MSTVVSVRTDERFPHSSVERIIADAIVTNVAQSIAETGDVPELSVSPADGAPMAIYAAAHDSGLHVYGYAILAPGHAVCSIRSGTKVVLGRRSVVLCVQEHLLPRGAAPGLYVLLQ